MSIQFFCAERSDAERSETVALADGISLETGVSAIVEFLLGRAPAPGGLYCDNRATVIAGRLGHSRCDELPRASRHVLLRNAAVLNESDRIWYIHTSAQRADGLTKSNNIAALRVLVHPIHKKEKK